MRMRITAIAVLCGLVAGFGYADEQFFDSDGVKIRYVVQGEGEPLVLIHGFTASVEANWGAPGLLEGLSKDYKVIALDCRGHGKSEKPHDPAAYGAQMSKDVKNLLDHLDIDKAHIAGYSMGGMITLHFINTYPERATSAIVGGMGWSEQPVGGDGFEERLATALENGDGLRPLMEALTPAGQPGPSDEEIKMMNTMLMTTNDPKALAAVARGFKGLALTKEQIAKNTVPTQGIIGEIDPLKVSADSMNANMPHLVSYVVIPGADHITAFGNPKFLSAMQEFLKAQSGAGEGSKTLKEAA